MTNRRSTGRAPAEGSVEKAFIDFVLSAKGQAIVLYLPDAEGGDTVVGSGTINGTDRAGVAADAADASV